MGDTLIDDLLDNVDLIDVFANTALKVQCFKSTETVIDNLKTSQENVKRKRSQVIRIPRMLKRDIRRSLCSMFCNVSNSYDEVLISSFFQTLACEGMQLIHRSPTSILRNLDLRGRDLITRYMFAYMNLSPDKIIRLTDVKIHQRVDSESSQCEIWANFSFEHTLIYETEPQRLGDALLKNSEYRDQNLLPVDGGIVDSSSLVAKKGKRKFCAFRESSKIVKQFRVEDHFDRLKEPLPIKVVGSLVFQINEEKKIEKLTCFPMSMGIITDTGLVLVPAVNN